VAVIASVTAIDSRVDLRRAIVALLERVQCGELSPGEATRDYARLMPAASGRAAGTARASCDIRSTSLLRAVDHPTHRLFVFLPFGFGNASVARWRTGLTGSIEAWTVGADDVADWTALTERLVREIAPLCDLPFLVFGHSMGAIVAYHVVAELERRGISPVAFVSSAAVPPHIFRRARFAAPFYGITGATDLATCRELLEVNHFLLPQNAGILMLGDRGLQCDIALLQHQPLCEPAVALRCPVVAWTASHDIMLKDTLMASLWSSYAAGYFSFEEIEGSHLYFMNPSRACFEKLAAYCSADFTGEVSPGVYDLVTMREGSDEMHNYPFGTRAAGVLIYSQTGGMAVHLWNPARDHDSTGPADPEDAILERMMSYTCYGGDYVSRRGSVVHRVQVSSLPNQVDSDLHRYVERDGSALALKTAPLVEHGGRQSARAGFGKLSWRMRDPGGDRLGNLLGDWELVSYMAGGEPRFGAAPRGQLLITASGMLSLIVADRELAPARYHNPVLASRDEILRTARGVDGLVARFEPVRSDLVRCRIVQGLFHAAGSALDMRWQQLPDASLELAWSAILDDRAIAIATRWRRAPASASDVRTRSPRNP
jgi:surfactin synthase thioesterase subunit